MIDKSAYLDNSATTRPTPSVIQAMADALWAAYYNPSSMYKPALQCEKRLKTCRMEIMNALSAPSGQVVFTSGGTEANNLAIIGSVLAMHGQRHILTTAQEHPSVQAAMEMLTKMGHKVTVLPVDACGQVDMERFRQALEDAQPPSLLSCMQVNNETGAMPDIEALSGMLKRRAPEALLHVDGVQGFLRTPSPVKYADLYTISAHKVHGPKGVGALYIRNGVRVLPREVGGGQENGLRSGTENTPGIIGFFEAIRELREMGDLEDPLREKKRLLYRMIIDSIPEAVLNGPGPDDGAPHILNMSFPGVRAEVLLHALEELNVYVSTGSACSSRNTKVSPVLLAMGLSKEAAESAIRFSISPFSSEEEILYGAECIKELYPKLRLIKRR